MKILRTILLSVLPLTLAAVSVSCEKMPEEVPSSGEQMRFGAENATFTMTSETKASTGTSAVTALTSFKVKATQGAAGSETAVSGFENVTFSKYGETSDYTGGKTWPASNPNYNFYATNLSGNSPMTFAAGGTTIAAVNTQDVVCAYLPYGDVTYKSKNTLAFEHIFARVGSVTVVQETGYTVSAITVSITPKTGGTYDLRAGAGHTDATGWSAVTTGSATTIASAVGANSNDVWMVPGTYTITASWTASQTGGSSVSYSNKTQDVVITGGKINAITATLGGEMVFGVEVQEFTDNEIPLAFGLHQSSSGSLFSWAGGSETLTLGGYAGTWTVDYSTDGGVSYGSAPSGVTVTRTSSNNGVQVFSVNLAEATPASSGVALGTWPTDARYNTVIGSAGSPVDLSLLDIHGNVLPGGRTTANTYVVHAPGTYMLPLVYGNAITNGSANTGSYIAPAAGSDIVQHLHNAYDTEISSPYIETDVAANGKAVSSADLVWSERTGMISVNSALETHGGVKYLVFSVDAASINYGNAVVCVKDGSGDIVWSWLIWVTGDELWDETVEARVSPATREVHFLSEAIGTVPPTGTGNIYGEFDCIVRFRTAGNQELLYTITRNEARVYTSFNGNMQTPWYQFGRNVPHPRSNVTGYAGASDGNQVSMATAIKNPGVFYIRSASPYNWCSDNSSKFYNVWNMSQTAAGQNKAVVKSIFDPSPAGYTMPRRDDFKYFTTDGANHSGDGAHSYFNVVDRNGDSSITSADFVRGWYMKRTSTDSRGLYFPAAGTRSNGSGAVSNVGSNGYYWSSSPTSAGSGYYLYFNSGSLNPLNNR